MATQLYNFETGSYESVPDEKVQEYILAGGHTFGEDQQVSIVLPNGQGYKVAGKKAAQALSLGAKFESESDAIRREYRQEYCQSHRHSCLGRSWVRSQVHHSWKERKQHLRNR